MINKIYCENCKYFDDHYTGYTCKAPGNIKNNGSVIYRGTICDISPEKLNKNRNCKYYKRKWYKFGV